MTKEECRVYDEVLMTHGKWWVPAQWFGSLAARARREGRIKDDVLFKHLLDVSMNENIFSCLEFFKILTNLFLCMWNSLQSKISANIFYSFFSANITDVLF